MPEPRALLLRRNQPVAPRARLGVPVPEFVQAEPLVLQQRVDEHQLAAPRELLWARQQAQPEWVPQPEVQAQSRLVAQQGKPA